VRAACVPVVAGHNSSPDEAVGRAGRPSYGGIDARQIKLYIDILAVHAVVDVTLFSAVVHVVAIAVVHVFIISIVMCRFVSFVMLFLSSLSLLLFSRSRAVPRVSWALSVFGCVVMSADHSCRAVRAVRAVRASPSSSSSSV